MIKSFVTLTLLATTLNVFAAPTEADRAAKWQFCEQRLANPTSIQQLLMDQKNQLSFTNHGGMMNGGVCWWHSRYTRNAAYVAQFRPDLPRPTDEKEIRKLAVSIRKGKFVVIPGYKNLAEFSTANYKNIQDKLEDWQGTDGILHFQWVAGLSGNTEVTPENLQQKMDALYERVSKGEVVYQKLQMAGIASHAWLVVGMTKHPTDGSYALQVLDSNYRGVYKMVYRPGMTAFPYSMGSFVPYTGKQKEEAKLRNKLKRECADYLKAQDAVASNDQIEDDETEDTEEN